MRQQQKITRRRLSLANAKSATPESRRIKIRLPSSSLRYLESPSPEAKRSMDSAMMTNEVISQHVLSTPPPTRLSRLVFRSSSIQYDHTPPRNQRPKSFSPLRARIVQRFPTKTPEKPRSPVLRVEPESIPKLKLVKRIRKSPRSLVTATTKRNQYSI